MYIPYLICTTPLWFLVLYLGCVLFAVFCLISKHISIPVTTLNFHLSTSGGWWRSWEFQNMKTMKRTRSWSKNCCGPCSERQLISRTHSVCYHPSVFAEIISGQISVNIFLHSPRTSILREHLFCENNILWEQHYVRTYILRQLPFCGTSLDVFQFPFHFRDTLLSGDRFVYV